MKIKLENKLRHSIINSKMIRRFIKTKDKGTIFVCQITEAVLKVAKAAKDVQHKAMLLGLEVKVLTPNIDDKQLSEKLNQALKKLEYNGNPIIVSLPRAQATCRYLKIPSNDPKEIEKIVNLQAPRYLPYQANELVTGYQLISTDKTGYSDINLVIVHKNLIERYIKIFKELKPAKFSVILSSYGLSNLLSFVKSEEKGTVMLVDIDFNQVELAVAQDKKILFNRVFKLSKTEPDWENAFINEINKTRDAYLKDVSKEPPAKILIFCENKTSQEFKQVLDKHINLPTDVISYAQKAHFSNDLLKTMADSEYSFASLIGLGIEETQDSLNLLPKALKEETKSFLKRKEKLRIISLAFLTIFIFALGTAKNLDSQNKYLGKLKQELNKIGKEARPLEELDKRIRIIESRLNKRLTSLDIVYELHRLMPNQIFLTNLGYEEDKQVVLRGQTAELDAVFSFVSQLEKSLVFKNFNLKVRYATKKKTQRGEFVDFEILCLKK